MDALLHQRLSRLEDGVRRITAAPTFPIYDPDDIPQDAVIAQIGIDTLNRLIWYDGIDWNYYIGTVAVAANAPQDVINGQIVVGNRTTCSLCWYSNEQWYTITGNKTQGNLPQDAIEGQIAIGSNTLAWYCDGNWYAIEGELV